MACKTVVAVSGAIDIITDGTRVLRVTNGDPLLQVSANSGVSNPSVIFKYDNSIQLVLSGIVVLKWGVQ